ncbi:MAG: ABC transporter substrate-binding protein [Prevotellaceae bacterium]|nr:ABC transporter substrate-binding protein [Prevotellaceae bacterium]
MHKIDCKTVEHFAILAIFVLAFFSCSQKRGEQEENLPSTQIKISYAKGFEIDRFKDYKRVTIKNPWKSDAIQQILYLVDNKEINTPQDGLKIVVPVNKIATGSTTYYGFLELLGKINSVKGICSANIVYNQTISKNFRDGHISDLGDAFNPNIERIMILQPQIFMLPSYNHQDETVKRLVNTGVSVVYNNEWTENSLLGRAEWLKFVAVFFNMENQADSIFTQIEKNYFQAKKLTENVKVKPTIMAGGNFKGTWYMPGGQSYMGQLFNDAGSDYLYKNDSTTTSLSLSYETVLQNFHGSQIWLNAPVNTLKKLFAMDERNKLFEAAQKGSVFAFTAAQHPDGANDFWENGVANPDKILMDVIWALHPTLLPDYHPVYIENLK